MVTSRSARRTGNGDARQLVGDHGLRLETEVVAELATQPVSLIRRRCARRRAEPQRLRAAAQPFVELGTSDLARQRLRQDSRDPRFRQGSQHGFRGLWKHEGFAAPWLADGVHGAEPFYGGYQPVKGVLTTGTM